MAALADGLTELTDWVGTDVADDWTGPALAKEISAATLPGLVEGLVELAGGSATEATWAGELLLAQFVRRELEATGSELVTDPIDPTDPQIRCAVESSGADGPRLWLLARPENTGPVVVIHGATRSRALLVDDLSGARQEELIGLDGLVLIDLSDLGDRGRLDPVLTRDGTDSLAALGAVIDAAVDLGICIGFLGRVGEYVLGGATDSAEVEVAALEHLGEAYATLGALSDGLRELVEVWDASAPGGRQELRRRAGELRLLGRDAQAALLSDLFEVAGARATSGRFGLDAPWRDFIARQAIHPIDAVLTPTNP